MSFGRILMLAGSAVSLFAVAAIVLVSVIPGPHTNGDYLIIGCLATLVALLALFVILITTSFRRGNNFFKRRRLR